MQVADDGAEVCQPLRSSVESSEAMSRLRTDDSFPRFRYSLYRLE